MIHKENLEKLLKASAKIHGHLCPGQVLGVRMAMHGMELVGIHDPKGVDRKKLYLFVEIDRCATDALQSITGCSLGHRNMRFMDYGKMAATFANLETVRAARVAAREASKMKAKQFFPAIEDKSKCQIEAYKIMSDEELFSREEVRIHILPQDLPGKPLRRAVCENCGEHGQDMREVHKDGKVLCGPCANGEIYFSKRKIRNNPSFLLHISTN